MPFEFFGARQYVGCAHGGASAFKSHIVGIHYTQMLKSEIAHRPRGCADVEGIARVHQDDAQTIEFGSARQRTRILRQAECPASQLPHPFLHCRVNVKYLSNLCSPRREWEETL